MRDGEITGVVYSNTLQIGYFNLESSSIIKGTKDRLFLMPVVIYFRKNFFLRTIVNTELKHYFEFGLIQKWKNDYVRDTSDTNAKTDRSRAQKSLEMHSLIGVFQLSGYLILFSILIFLMELFSRRVRLFKIFIEFFTY